MIIHQFGKIRRKANQRRAGINGSTDVVQLNSLLAEGDCVQFNFPGKLAAKRKLHHLSGVMVLVDAAQCDLSFVALTVLTVAKIKGEEWCMQQALVEHIIERRDHVIDSNSVKTHT